MGNESMAGMEDVLADAEAEEALAEFDFLVSESGEGAGEARSQGDATDWGEADFYHANISMQLRTRKVVQFCSIKSKGTAKVILL